MATTRINVTESATVTHEWGAIDAKGRQHGLMIRTFECDYVENGTKNGWVYDAGHYFCAKIQMTKDGKPWGPNQSPRHFATAELRTAEILKRLAAAIKKTK